MSRIDAIFASLRADGRTALMPFITGGHPTLSATAATLERLENAGASIVEIGFPFSDPIADGPVIAEAMHEAIVAGVTPDHIFRTVASVRASTGLGLMAMVSQSIVRRMGEERFLDRARESGFDGLIVPDLDLDDAESIARATADRELSLPQLVSHLSPPARVERLLALSTGFVYLLARAGITGESDAEPQVEAFVDRVRGQTKLPLAVGFGISTADHVRAVTTHADAAIVGSALVRRMAASPDPASAAASFVSELAQGLVVRSRESG